jgi:low temperature requirement protein LtrA
MAIWSAWSATTWVTSWFDAHARQVRLLLLGVMLGSLFMSAAISDAFGDGGLAFALPYVAIQVGRNAWALAAVGRGHPDSRTFQRVLLWSVALGMLWIAGAIAEGDRRVALWALAVVLDYVATWFGLPIPGLGRSHTPEWTIAGAHLAERYELFIIFALGESILVTGATYGGLARSGVVVLAFIVAFAGSATLWWLYFDRGAEAGREAITHAGDAGWLGLFAYAYFHLPMVAGIIMVAGADELVIAHPIDPSTTAMSVLIVGGPAVYLAGNALFTWALAGTMSWSRLAAIAALVALLPLAARVPALTLLVVATLVLIALARWDLRAARARRCSVGRRH